MVGLGALGVLTGRWLQSGVDQVMAVVGNRAPVVSDLVPGGGGFRYYSVTGDVPRRTPATYRLQVGGLVQRPFTVSYDELARLPQTQLSYDFQCVTGWRVQDVAWSGVRVRDLLERAGVRDGARALRFTSYDGAYTESLTLEQARRDDVLVALTMLGAPVSDSHGGPVRLYVAPMYGYKSLKWLDAIEVTDRVTPGYWEQRGYDVDAWVGRSNRRSDEPTS